MADAARVPDLAAPAADDPIRQKLIESAAQVFAEKGYDRAGVAEIARRAGYTTGAIYGRFTGKAELLLAAIEARSNSELDQLFAEHRFDGKVTDILTTVGSHLVTDPDDENGALLLEAFVAARRDPEVRRLMQGALDLRGDRLADLVAEAQLTGAIDPALDAEAVVRFCHAVGFGFLLFRAIDMDLPKAGPWEDLIARLVEALDANPALPHPTDNEGDTQ
ncbi:MAG TPA: helix-turn-helix domain-containing protein [Acidimicrobiales bacterium]|nr:helix-turn-helix domain-containing protein [Acidimicrobiales bacterium]